MKKELDQLTKQLYKLIEFTARCNLLEDNLKNNTFENHLVIKWFREVKMIKIIIYHTSCGLYNYEIRKWNFDNTIGDWERISHIGSYIEYELAEVAGILHAESIISPKIKFEKL